MERGPGAAAAANTIYSMTEVVVQPGNSRMDGRHSIWLTSLRRKTQDLRKDELRIYRDTLEIMFIDARPWTLLTHCKTFAEMESAIAWLANYADMVRLNEDAETYGMINLEDCVRRLFLKCPMVRLAVQDGYKQE